MSVGDNTEISAKLKAVQKFKRLLAFPANIAIFFEKKLVQYMRLPFRLYPYCRANQEWQCRNIALTIDK